MLFHGLILFHNSINVVVPKCYYQNRILFLDESVDRKLQHLTDSVDLIDLKPTLGQIDETSRPMQQHVCLHLQFCKNFKVGQFVRGWIVSIYCNPESSLNETLRKSWKEMSFSLLNWLSVAMPNFHFVELNYRQQPRWKLPRNHESVSRL